MSGRQGYRATVEMVALNDEPECTDAEAMAGCISVGVVAFVFGKTAEQVAHDVVRHRVRLAAEEAQRAHGPGVQVAPSVVHRRARHAAHTGNGGGWDLDVWDVVGVRRPEEARRELWAAHLPRDAEYHSGYLDKQGVQHWVFVRRAPLSPGRCPTCPAVAS